MTTLVVMNGNMNRIHSILQLNRSFRPFGKKDCWTFPLEILCELNIDNPFWLFLCLTPSVLHNKFNYNISIFRCYNSDPMWNSKKTKKIESYRKIIENILNIRVEKWSMTFLKILIVYPLNFAKFLLNIFYQLLIDKFSGSNQPTTLILFLEIFLKQIQVKNNFLLLSFKHFLRFFAYNFLAFINIFKIKLKLWGKTFKFNFPQALNNPLKQNI